MRAVVIERLVESEQALSGLTCSKVDIPKLERKGDVLVHVMASGVNFPDALLAQGKYQQKPALPFILGTEFAGVVQQSQGQRFKAGDRVMGFVLTGAFAEFICVDESDLVSVPESFSLEEAAAFLLTYGTSYYALIVRAQLKAGETVLVHAAAGGVGSAAVQIAKAVGARVIATAGSEGKVSIAKSAGADFAINYSLEKDWPAQVKSLTKGRGAHVIYDPVGGDVFRQSLKCIAWNGRLLVIGFASGQIPKISANLLLLKNCSVVGVFFGAFTKLQSSNYKSMLQDMLGLAVAGHLRPIIGAKYPLEETGRALFHLTSRMSYGKLILTTRAASSL